MTSPTRRASDRDDETRYWELEGEELAKAVQGIADDLRDTYDAERLRCQDSISRYEGLHLTTLDPRAYYQEGTLRTKEFGLAKSVVDTVHAQMVGRPKNRPRIITTGAKWQTQRAAKKLEKVVRGQLSLRQGMFTSAQEVRDRAWLDCEITGNGWLKISPGTDQVLVERIFPWEVLVDPIESQTGNPRTVLHVYPADKDELIARYVDGEAGESLSEEERSARLLAIEKASNSRIVPDSSSTKCEAVTRTCDVVELHRAARGKDDPGMIVVVVNGCVLEQQEWKRSGTRFVKMTWCPRFQGISGIGIVEELASLLDLLVDMVRSVGNNFKVRNGRRTWVNEDCEIKEEELESNEADTIVHYTGTMPVESVVPPLSPGELEALSFFRSWIYQMAGVSEMAATSRKEPGITAAKAIRAVQDIWAQRLAAQGKALDRADIDIFSKVIWSLQDLAEQTQGKLKLRFRAAYHLQEIDWSDCKPEDEIYDVEVQSESEVATSVSGRISAFQEALASGVMSPQTFQRVLEGTLDTGATSEAVQEQYAYLEEEIDRMLDWGDQPKEDFTYDPPEGPMPDKAGALAQVVASYFRAKRQSFADPEGAATGLELLRDYMTQLSDMIAVVTNAAAGAKNATPALMPEAGGLAAVPPPAAFGAAA